MVELANINTANKHNNTPQRQICGQILTAVCGLQPRLIYGENSTSSLFVDIRKGRGNILRYEHEAQGV
jgi:hypothetical protein